MSKESVSGERVVLVVEDEPLLLEQMKRMLQLINSDFEILTASGYENALEVFEKVGRKIDLLITNFLMIQRDGICLISDLLVASPRMPQKDGVDLIVECFKRRWTTFPVIVASSLTGEARSKVNETLKMNGEGIVYLQKVYSMSDFKEALEKALR